MIVLPDVLKFFVSHDQTRNKNRVCFSYDRVYDLTIFILCWNKMSCDGEIKVTVRRKRGRLFTILMLRNKIVQDDLWEEISNEMNYDGSLNIKMYQKLLAYDFEVYFRLDAVRTIKTESHCWSCVFI